MKRGVGVVFFILWVSLVFPAYGAIATVTTLTDENDSGTLAMTRCELSGNTNNGSYDPEKWASF